MKEKMQKLLDDLQKNPLITIKEDSFVAYRELKAVTLSMDVEELEDEGWMIGEDQWHLLNLSGLRLEWESSLSGVDVALTGGFEFNSLVDALTMPSAFWKGAFSIPDGDPAPEHLKHFSDLGWFCKQVWDDGRRSCFLKQPGDFPPPVAFYSRGWFVKMDVTFEEYLNNMFKMFGAKGWQFFFIDITPDIPYLQDVLKDMRIITEQFPLLFPEKDWSHLRAKYEDTRKLLV